MQQRKLGIVWFALIISLSTALFLLVLPEDTLAVKYRRINVGMPFHEVWTLLGEPRQ
jgi:hypothetical protein